MSYQIRVIDPDTGETTDHLPAEDIDALISGFKALSLIPRYEGTIAEVWRITSSGERRLKTWEMEEIMPAIEENVRSIPEDDPADSKGDG